MGGEDAAFINAQAASGISGMMAQHDSSDQK